MNIKKTKVGHGALPFFDFCICHCAVASNQWTRSHSKSVKVPVFSCPTGYNSTRDTFLDKRTLGFTSCSVCPSHASCTITCIFHRALEVVLWLTSTYKAQWDVSADYIVGNTILLLHYSNSRCMTRWYLFWRYLTNRYVHVPQLICVFSKLSSWSTVIDLHLFQDYQKITESTDNESGESLGTTVKVVNKVIMHVQLLILLYYACISGTW